jgi:hypothetical protein
MGKHNINKSPQYPPTQPMPQYPNTGRSEITITEEVEPTEVYKRDTILIMTHKTYTKQIIDWLNQNL